MLQDRARTADLTPIDITQERPSLALPRRDEGSQRFTSGSASPGDHPRPVGPLKSQRTRTVVFPGGGVLTGLLLAGLPAAHVLLLLFLLTSPPIMVLVSRGHRMGAATPQAEQTRGTTEEAVDGLEELRETVRRACAPVDL